MKSFWKRRQILLMGLGLGTVARVHSEYQRDRNFQQQSQSYTDAISASPENIVDTAYNIEADWETEIAQRQEIINATSLEYPRVDYDRSISEWLIQSCKLAVQQYRTGRSNPKYDGELTLLPDYNANFGKYRQVSSLQISEEIVENYWQLQESLFTDDEDTPMMRTFHDAESKIRELVQRIVQRRHRLPVYVGFVLESDQGNIIAFRGTQTQIEWWKNLQAAQRKYVDLKSGKYYGMVHQGYLKLVREQVGPQLIEAVRKLNPDVPCYITGHSLGSAVATLSAMEIALQVPEIQPNIQLYTYAGPRIGDREFAQSHSKLIPNSFRIVNLSDSVPLVPPIKIENSFTKANYAHVGQKWAFSAQFGDVLLNHVVDTYSMAIVEKQENLQEDSVERMM